jgi:hypothetical protein
MDSQEAIQVKYPSPGTSKTNYGWLLYGRTFTKCAQKSIRSHPIIITVVLCKDEVDS